MNNLLAHKTIQYIWQHPNCRNQKFRSIARFFQWQLYKRLIGQQYDLQLLPNLKIRCYDNSASASAALYCGLYDYHEMNFLLRYLRSEDYFIDIGANIGIYTLLAASVIQSGEIFSFEALSRNYDRLVENLALNQLNQVIAHRVAISDCEATAFLELGDQDSTASITDQIDPTNAILVPTTTLNTIFRDILNDQKLGRLTLGKMDIEGGELKALQGATSLLQKSLPPVWIIEILNGSDQKANHYSTNVVSFLEAYHYHLYEYDADTNNLTPTSLEQHHGNNFLAIADSALDFVQDRTCKTFKLS